MLRVTIELVPMGIEDRKSTIGCIEIANDGSGTGRRGNYKVRLARRGASTARAWRTGAVKNFPRVSKGPYDLLLHALVATVGDRNERLLDLLIADLAETEAEAAA